MVVRPIAKLSEETCSGAARDVSVGRAPGIAPSASLIRIQTFMLTTTPTISRIYSRLEGRVPAPLKAEPGASRR
jgi:hypothetical protein